jgi:hypothetical protein
MTNETTKRRKPYPKERDPRRTRFTLAMWARWLSEQRWAKVPLDRTTLRLRAGIAEFRDRIHTRVAS